MIISQIIYLDLSHVKIHLDKMFENRVVVWIIIHFLIVWCMEKNLNVNIVNIH